MAGKKEELNLGHFVGGPSDQPSLAPLSTLQDDVAALIAKSRERLGLPAQPAPVGWREN